MKKYQFASLFDSFLAFEKRDDIAIVTQKLFTGGKVHMSDERMKIKFIFLNLIRKCLIKKSSFLQNESTV
jgi:hypothetical protein